MPPLPSAVRVDARCRLHNSAASDFAAGVTLSDGHKCRSAGLEVLEVVDDPAGSCHPFPSVVRVRLTEGHYHQVKRMLGVCGAAVCGLHRERIGAITLEDYPELREGMMTMLGDREDEALLAMLPSCRVAQPGRGFD
jgi:16S rRNA pseudouridine516 synthase